MLRSLLMRLLMADQWSAAWLSNNDVISNELRPGELLVLRWNCEKTFKYKEIRAIAHCNTILNQIASFLPRHDSERLAKIYHSGQKFRSFTHRTQFIAMPIAQLTGRKSLCDLISNLAVKGKHIYLLDRDNYQTLPVCLSLGNLP
jgi:hypothetical protein